MFAAVGGSLQAVKLLLDHGADPNLASKFSMTAMIAAAGKGHFEVTYLLTCAKRAVACNM